MFLRCGKCLLGTTIGIVDIVLKYFVLQPSYFLVILSSVCWDLLPVVFGYSRHLMVSETVTGNDF